MSDTGLTAERLRELLDYDPETGLFRWRKRIGTRCANGWFAGCPSLGYRLIRIEGSLHKAHRLAWLHVHGELPEFMDHRNGDRQDNRLVNLRPATRRQNQQNQKTRADNTTGAKGVHRKRSKFVATIQVNYRTIRLGVYPTVDEASAAYRQAAALHFGEFVRAE